MSLYLGARSRSEVYLGSRTDTAIYLGLDAFFPPESTPGTFVAATAFQSGTAGLTVNFSTSGRAAGDLLAIHIETANQNIVTPSGFYPAPASPQGTGTGGAAGAVKCYVFLRESDGTETTVSIGDSGDHQTAIGYVFRDVDATSYVNMLNNSNDLTNSAYWHTFPDGTATIGAGNLLTITGVTVQSDKGIYTDIATLKSGATFTLLFDAQTDSGTAVFAANIYYQTASTEADNISPDITATTTVQRHKHTVTMPAGVTFTNLGFCSGAAKANTAVKITRVQLVPGDVDIDYPYVATTTGVAASFPGVNVSAGATQASTTAFSFPGVTPTVDNSLIAHFVANDRDAASTANLSSVSNANLTSLTKQFDQTVTTGQGGGLALITGVKAVAGATGNTTATQAGTGNTNATVTLALAPAA